MRRTPRIISRSRKNPSSVPIQERNCIVTNEIDDELGEGLIVQGGVIMHVKDLTSNEPSTSASSSLQKKTSRRSGQISSNFAYLKEAPTQTAETFLPDTANDVESYPCDYCTNRIFLTAAGLERHTRDEHPDRIFEVLKKIAEISDEWRRRESEKKKWMEQTLIKDIDAATFSKNSFVERGRNERNRENCAIIEQIYEPCSICGILINVLHPSAMTNHIRAHSKNDQLRNQLLAEYGPECVARLTCSECQSVFSDERKLFAHIEFSHSRRKTFICKWCGHVCQSMGALNLHKNQRHGLLSTKDRNDLRRYHMKSADHSCAIAQANVRRKDHNIPHVFPKYNATENYFMDKLSIREDLHCRTACEICGLNMTKPSLLIRHMLRVHNRSSFTAVVEIKTLSPIKVEVTNGKITWWCCDTPFHNRVHFSNHRRTAHQIRYDFNEYVHDSSICEHIGQSSENMHECNIERLNNSGINEETDNIHQDESHECVINLLQDSVMQDGSDVYFLLVSDENHSDDNKGENCWDTTDPSISSGTQHIALTADQYEQLRMQVNGNLDNMQIVFMDDDAFPDQLENQQNEGLLSAEPLIENVQDDPLGPNFLQLDHEMSKTRSTLTNIPVPGICVTVHSNP